MNLSTFTSEQLQAARVYAASNPRAMAAEAMTATYYADHVDHAWRLRIQEEKNQLADEAERGEHDHNFTIRQRMYYYLTGESVALLP